MSFLYLNEDGTTLGISGNRVEVRGKDMETKSIPIETLESVTVLGKAQITTQAMIELMERGISISYFSKGGKYFGKMQSNQHVNPKRQRKQCALADTDFAVDFSRKILEAKMRNQTVVLRRYARSRKIDCNYESNQVAYSMHKLSGCTSIFAMIGYEGYAAKNYFAGLAKCVEEEFSFSGRSKQP
ncbi:MAG: CRISPR-associated endonuclease Cas1, partial [Bacteroidales bacterium]|nr:CRISPR-associated endonuclease Cas1 [Bacteroidales bacterium]